jgi:hypothetical protein
VWGGCVETQPPPHARRRSIRIRCGAPLASAMYCRQTPRSSRAVAMASRQTLRIELTGRSAGNVRDAEHGQKSLAVINEVHDRVAQYNGPLNPRQPQGVLPHFRPEFNVLAGMPTRFSSVSTRPRLSLLHQCKSVDNSDLNNRWRRGNRNAMEERGDFDQFGPKRRTWRGETCLTPMWRLSSKRGRQHPMQLGPASWRWSGQRGDGLYLALEVGVGSPAWRRQWKGPNAATPRS